MKSTITKFKKGHKKNNSYDFIGFTYKPESWMDLKEFNFNET